MKAENEKLTEANKKCDEANQKNLDTLKDIHANADNKYDDYQSYMTGYDSTWNLNDASDLAEIKAAGKALYDKIYGTEQQAMEDDGTTPKVDKDGNPVMERVGGMTGDLKTLQDDLKTAQETLKQKEKDLADGVAGVTQADVDAAKTAVATASEAVSKKQSEINKAKRGLQRIWRF